MFLQLVTHFNDGCPVMEDDTPPNCCMKATGVVFHFLNSFNLSSECFSDTGRGRMKGETP